ncbi:MAG: 3-hydroxyacyl-CoA dehydrogenase [Chromatiales bacterium]|nr:3-hydroxyacyl-CoA dehydrogenase [Chromatiales bacterium]
MNPIRSVAVLGAGTMGTGIAAHLANAGVRVLLLDVPGKADEDRDAPARRGLDRIRRGRPPALMSADDARRIEPGNVEDHLGRLGEVDWIVEAVVERLEVKHALYRAVDAARRPGTPVSSNTSTIPLAQLVAGMPAAFAADFCITHFFNPVRYMRLLELVRGPATRPEVIEHLGRFCDEALGKGVVPCRDTPGFLANRIGVYALQLGIAEALRAGVTVEEADALLGRPAGIPKTAVFGLYDLIGVDLMLDVVASLRRELAPDDAFHRLGAELPLLEAMVAAGRTGNKGGAGFYRTREVDGEPRREVLELTTGEYRAATRPHLAAAEAGERDGLRALVEADDRYGRYAWRVLSGTLAYAAALLPEVGDDPAPIDAAMTLGYSWREGPLEMIDALGVGWFRDRLRAEGRAVPPLLEVAGNGSLYRDTPRGRAVLRLDGEHQPVARPAGVERLAEHSRGRRPLAGNPSASLWDVGDGVLVAEFHSKANALDADSMHLLAVALERVPRAHRALIVYNDAPHFSMGVNLGFVLDAAERGAWSEVDRMLVDFQQTCLGLRDAPFPVIGAPAGMALGGGFEVLAHCDALACHANVVLGLVEPQVGLVPAGGGCKEMLARFTARAGDAAVGARDAFAQIAAAATASSVPEARPMLLVRDHDVATMHRDRVLPTARALARERLAGGYSPTPAPVFHAAGAPTLRAIVDGLAADRDAGRISAHDVVVGEALARVLCGGDVAPGTALTEPDLLDLERASFLGLLREPSTRARIRHTLATGRPLRN